MTIIDDDEHQTCSDKTTLSSNGTNLGETTADVPLQFTVHAVSCSGQAQNAGGDIYKAVARRRTTADEMVQGILPSFVGTFGDKGDGTYQGTVNVTTTGHYELDVYLLVPAGLTGSYFTDAFLSNTSLDLVRADATVNFTFGTGPLTTFARDFASVRWEGCILSLEQEGY